MANLTLGAFVKTGELKRYLLDNDTQTYDLEHGFTRHPIFEDDKGVSNGVSNGGGDGGGDGVVDIVLPGSYGCGVGYMYACILLLISTSFQVVW